MRFESIGQAISFELALILQCIYVPRHLRNTVLFKDAWNAGVDLIWKANDLIGCAKDNKVGNPVNSVNLLAMQRDQSLSEARNAYNVEVYEPAVQRFRRALNPETLAEKMHAQLIVHPHEQQVMRKALDCISHICWASLKWNRTVARYKP
jgi:hypothetical protein